MTTRLQIHPDNPQQRLIRQVVDAIRQGAIVAYPTSAGYSLGCHLDDKTAVDRIRQIRHLDKHHNFTLQCRDLSDIANYARVDNPSFRLLKANTPGAYTFILPATKEVPKRLQHPKRKTIGIRVPLHTITQAMLEMLGQPLMSVSLLTGEDSGLPLIEEVDDVFDQFEGKVDVFVDAGDYITEPTTVIDLTSGTPQILREGRGDPAPFL